MTYNRMQDLLKQEPSDLLANITTQYSRFPDVLNDDQSLDKHDFMTSILAILGKALMCETSPAAIIVLLNMVRQSTFLKNKVPMFVANMTTMPAG